MLNPCRSASEPCQCARCRCGRQMSNRPMMPCPAETRPPNGSKNYRRPPCCGNGRRRPDPPVVAQDFPRECAQSPVCGQEYPGQLPQDYRNFCQQAPRNDFQQCPWNGGQQAPRNDFQQGPCNGGQQAPRNDFQQGPCNCGQQSPRNGFQPDPWNGGQQFSGIPNQQFSGIPNQQFSGVPNQQFSEIPNQQLWQDYGQPSPQNSLSNGSAGSNPEQDCGRPNCPGRRRKKRNRRRCSCEYVVTHEVGVQTEDEPAPPETPPAVIIQHIDVTTQEKEVRHRTGEVEIVVDEFQSVTNVPTDGSMPTKEHIQSRVVTSKTNANTEDNQKIESHFEEEVKPIYVNVKPPNDPMDLKDLEPILKNLRSTLPSGFTTPTEEKDTLVYRTNTTYERDYQNPSERTVTQTITQEKPAGSSPSLTRSSPSSPRKLGSPTHMPVATVKLGKRSPSGEDVVSSKPKKIAHFNAASPKRTAVTPPKRKFSPRGAMEQLSEEQMVINRTVPKPRASDFDNRSTVHVKVVNRQETVSKRPNRDSIKKMAVYERRISELRVKDLPEEETEETTPATTPEPEPKPEKKKPKRKRMPKMEMKHGYPSNDLVCRMHRPPRKQLCPPCCGAVCRGYSCSCFGPCASSPCPRQCDPIYGFGSMPIAYYCH